LAADRKLVALPMLDLTQAEFDAMAQQIRDLLGLALQAVA